MLITRVHKQAVPFLTWKGYKAKITCVRSVLCFTNLTSLKSNESNANKQFSVRQTILRSFLDDFKISNACSVKRKRNVAMNASVKA